jgi:hypothetical protein
VQHAPLVDAWLAKRREKERTVIAGLWQKFTFLKKNTRLAFPWQNSHAPVKSTEKHCRKVTFEKHRNGDLSHSTSCQGESCGFNDPLVARICSLQLPKSSN